MGEQSVGKSFALNHFVDTSFAGSAMGTTGRYPYLIYGFYSDFYSEGVWLSVTPTEDYLIVALDFRGLSLVNHQSTS